MGFCRNCNKEIEDGIEYCDECSIFAVDNGDESYLDDLLNSVVNPDSSGEYDEDEQSDEDLFDFMTDDYDESIFDGIEDSDIFEEDVEDSDDTNDIDNINDIHDDDNINDMDDIESFNESDNIEDDHLDQDTDNEMDMDFILPDDSSDELSDSITDDLSFDEESNDDDSSDILDIDSLNLNDTDEDDNSDFYDTDESNILPDMDATENMDFNGGDAQEEDNSELNDLLSGMMFDEESESIESSDEDTYNNSDDSGLDDNFMEMLNMSDDTSSTDDNDSNDYNSDDGMDLSGMFDIDEIGDINSSSSDDENNDSNNEVSDENILDLIPDINEKNAKKEKKDKKKNGLLSKLFGNVNAGEENRPKELEPPKSENEETPEGEKLSKKELKELKKKEKAEKKGKGDAKSGDEEGSEDKTSSEEKVKEKKAKKEKKVKEKPEEVIEEYEGEINKIGALIVFVFIAVICAVGIMGTKMYIYKSTISKAESYFDMKKYTKAYDKIIGVELKELDKELYDKIEAVMFINRQYESHFTYMQMERYPEALDALIRGLTRYDTALERYQDLGIKKDLDYVKESIVSTLKGVYGISEKAAKEIGSIEDKELYSESINSIVNVVNK